MDDPADNVQSLVEQYRLLLSSRESADPESFAANYGPLTNSALADLLRTDQRYRWTAGDRKTTEEYLAQFPQIADDYEAALDLIYAEYLIREDEGSDPSPDEFLKRFPRYAKQLAMQLELNQMLDDSAPEIENISVLLNSVQGTLVANPAVSDKQEIGGTFGRYEIVRLLGQGGMGRVYLARDTLLDRQVALKLPDTGMSEQDKVVVLERFRREARAAARIHHHRLCSVYDACVIDGRPSIVMQYIEGETLASLLRKVGVVSQREAATWTLQIAEALETVHQAGVLHRDLKPGNIMINLHGEAVVMDFGLAQLCDPDQSTITISGAFLGTPAYASPEQMRGENSQLTAASDVYSLGTVLYHMLSGAPPYSGSFPVIGSKVLNSKSPPRVSATRPQVKESLDNICLKAMAKNASDRFSGMLEFTRALKGIESALPFEPLVWQNSDASASSASPNCQVLTETVSAVPSTSWKKLNWGKFAMWASLASVPALVAVAAWVSSRGPETTPQQSSVQVATLVTPVSTAKQMLDLKRSIGSAKLADGRREDVHINDDILTLDATGQSPQLWLDFVDVRFDNLSIETRLRIGPDNSNGYVKLVLLSQPECHAMLTGPPDKRWVQLVTGPDASQQVETVAPFAGAETTCSFALKADGERVQLILDGIVLLESSRTSVRAGHVSLVVSGWRCEFSEAKVIPVIPEPASEF